MVDVTGVDRKERMEVGTQTREKRLRKEIDGLYTIIHKLQGCGVFNEMGLSVHDRRIRERERERVYTTDVLDRADEQGRNYQAPQHVVQERR